MIAFPIQIDEVIEGFYGLIQAVSAETFTLMVSAANSGVIESVGGNTSVGTCTIQVFINGVALGGTATSITTTYSEVSHVTNNTYVEGDVVTMTISNLASDPANLNFVLKMTKPI